MYLGFSQHICEKYSNIKFRENPSIENRVVPFGRTEGQKDRHDKANSRFLGNFANEP